MENTANSDEHVLILNDMILSVDDGLVLGNGDLSVSIYQKVGEIVWRFGKGDVWDRRHQVEENPTPITMDELRHGIAKEGWICPAYGGDVEALHGTKHPKRMLEALAGPPSQKYPYPMPKPVGELTLHWPADLQKLKITQKLFVEQGRVEIICEWLNGEQLKVDCFIHPQLNVLVVNWNLTGFHPGSPQPFFKTMPVWLSLYRWADTPIAEFSAKWMNQYGCPMFSGFVNPKATTLPPPEVIEHAGYNVIEQKFYEDPLFPDGFRYWMGCLTDQVNVEQIDTGPLNEARLLISPVTSMDIEFVSEFMTVDQQLRDGTLDYPEPEYYSGWAIIPVTTSSDKGGPQQEFDRICKLVKKEGGSVIKKWKKESVEAARKFWSASAVKIAEPTLEDLWYETLHICRCVYRKGTIPPGLFMSSTINDHVLWKGDYHTNYNIQQPFWGFLTSNHPELDEPYFTIMDFHNQIGQKIAKDYCGTRGTFIQICGYPIKAKDDPYGSGPMGRMPYMTGYVPELDWWHYLYTQDVEYLRDRGYPFIRDCALFYTDFLQLGDDGLYHAFPSCWGEEGYDGTIEKNMDSLQTIEHARSSMSMALRAAKLLGVDSDLQKDWQERIDKLAPGLGEAEWLPLPEAADGRHQKFNVPGFRPGENYRFPNKWTLSQRWWGWADKLTISWIRDVRGGQFKPDEEFSDLVKVIQRWRHPNGLVWPMPIRYYGNPGGWTEVFGIIEPLQEMLLQSWDGSIRLFPAWPTNVDAGFKQFRAEGAFLVSADKKDGCIGDVMIESLAGCSCTVVNPWPDSTVRVIQDDTNKAVLEEKKTTITFDTQKGKQYRIEFVR